MDGETEQPCRLTAADLWAQSTCIKPMPTGSAGRFKQ